ncbi:ABC transporter ATP-binding protein [Clostridium polynesiense]|uniref:iron ABC transporter ATP-binding protein n=1 Tax=Clostridium polynesiense TaxID=1325933 RepID=UPI00058C2BAC|nr:ATP-binding cassette domain-containing protein [Clostridium polynesiense]
MIKVRNLKKYYGDKNVVNNVSINLEKGRLISFIGANGAGKSTVLSMVSRLISKDSGEIIIEGRELSQWDNSELSKKLSILPQANYMNIRLKVRELVSFGRFPYSQGRLTKEDNRIIDEALNYMGLKEYENRYIDELSGGERQMSFIAMTIAQDTEYIFLDEPLNNLDMKHSSEIMKILRRLVDELKKTVIIVIHDINFASCYSDYIVALKKGEVIKEGGTDEIIDKNVLKEIYDLDIHIESVKGKKICNYFQ